MPGILPHPVDITGSSATCPSGYGPDTSPRTVTRVLGAGETTRSIATCPVCHRLDISPRTVTGVLGATVVWLWVGVGATTVGPARCAVVGDHLLIARGGRIHDRQ